MQKKNENSKNRNTTPPSASHFNYFFIKQCIFIPILLVSGFAFIYSWMFILSPGKPGTSVKEDVGYVITILMLSLPLATLVAGIFSASIAGNLAARIFNVTEFDKRYSYPKRIIRWYTPYFAALIGYVLILLLLASYNVNNDSVYVILSTLLLPPVLYISDRMLFYEYYELIILR